MYKISVVVCTYNRSKLLKGAIESLLDQTLDKSQFEIIIADNGSTDDTKYLVKAYIDKHNEYNIRYICEPKQGSSNARNAGFRNANSQYIAFMDDDAKADKHWLENIVKTITNIKPHILGGPIYPFYLTEKPEWFLDKYEIRTKGDKARFLTENEYMSGSNIILKKSLLELINGCNPNIGPKGEKMGYGEDTKLIIDTRQKIKDARIYYNPQIIVQHLVPADKMRLGYFIKRSFDVGICHKDIWCCEITLWTKIKHLINVLYMIWRIVSGISIGMMFRDKGKYKYRTNYIVEVICPHAQRLIISLTILKPTSACHKK
jgi:glycosyltransferase involved in cell wall biosynthesis